MEKRPVVQWVWDFDSQLSCPEVYSGQLTVHADVDGISLRLKGARRFSGESLNNQDLFRSEFWESVPEITWEGLTLTSEREGELTFQRSGSSEFLIARGMIDPHCM